jgi:hypothetical protein
MASGRGNFSILVVPGLGVAGFEDFAGVLLFGLLA